MESRDGVGLIQCKPSSHDGHAAPHGVSKRPRKAKADFVAVKAALDKAGLKPEIAEITMKPSVEAALGGEDAARMRQLLDALEGLDDVQDVYTTAVID